MGRLKIWWHPNCLFKELSYRHNPKKTLEEIMDKGIYTALSGGIAKGHELELIANNLANSNTPGFKKDTGTFNEYLMELRRPDTVEGLKREIEAQTMFDGRPPGDKSFVEMDGIYTNHEQGSLQKTGRSLDIALQGSGMFEVLTPSGIRYTRQGNFNIAPDGKLVTVNGFPVLSSERAIPKDDFKVEVATDGRVLASESSRYAPPTKLGTPESRVIFVKDGALSVTEDGGLYSNNIKFATIAVEEFHENQLLEKVGNSYFRNVNPKNIKTEEGVTTKTIQGFIESSNVNPVREMTRLIEATRAYESHMQAIKTYQDMDGRTVNDIARR